MYVAVETMLLVVYTELAGCVPMATGDWQVLLMVIGDAGRVGEESVAVSIVGNKIVLMM